MQTLNVVITALRGEADLILANVPEFHAEGATVHAIAHTVAAEALVAVAGRIQNDMAPESGPESASFEFSALPPEGRTVRTSQEVIENVALDTTEDQR